VAGLLVLWDIDYTLVEADGVGRRLYEMAFAELYGRPLAIAPTEVSMAGRTDRAISMDVLRLAGVPDPRGEVGRFEAALTRLAPAVADLVAATGRALPGAAAALTAIAALAGRAGPRQSVLTGNVRALAAAKLAPLGLAPLLNLDVGAYGDEHEVRAELVHLARRRSAAAYGRRFDGEGTVLVGDTPLDVHAAKATGARAVAVATGHFTAGQLAAAGADAVLADLTDTGQVLSAVLGR